MKALETKAEFDEYLVNAGDKLVVIDFFAEWCGPCKVIGPKVVELEKSYPDVFFAKVDVDVNDETAEYCEISAMPTFRLYKNGKQVDQMTGANEAKLKDLVEKYK